MAQTTEEIAAAREVMPKANPYCMEKSTIQKGASSTRYLVYYNIDL